MKQGRERELQAQVGERARVVRVGTERGVWKRMVVVGRSFYVGLVWTGTDGARAGTVGNGLGLVGLGRWTMRERGQSVERQRGTQTCGERIHRELEA